MAWWLYYYDDDKKTSDFTADPFFREPHVTGVVPTSNYLLHTDGLLYSGGYIGTAATGYLVQWRPPGSQLVLSGVTAIRHIVSWSGSLWFVSWDGAAQGTLHKWDGVTLSTKDSTGILTLPKLIATRDSIVMAFAGTGNVIRRYSLTAGTASNLAMPGTTFGVTNYASYEQLVEYKGKVYIFGTDSTGATIYSVDGTTVAVARTGLAGTARTLAVFNGYLYYLVGSYLGRYNGAAWDDTHSDVSALTPKRLVQYKGNLLLFDSTAVHKSSGTDTTTWTATASTSTTDAHPGQAPGDVFYGVY